MNGHPVYLPLIYREIQDQQAGRGRTATREPRATRERWVQMARRDPKVPRGPRANRDPRGRGVKAPATLVRPDPRDPRVHLDLRESLLLCPQAR